jgi:hypothetical protein
MALPFRTARGIVGVKLESTPYTFLEPGNSDSFHAVNIAVNPILQNYDRKDTSSHFGIRDGIPGSAEVEISFEIVLVGASSAGTAPFWATAMMACGHQQVATAGTSILYKPTTLFDGSVAAGPPVVTQPGEVYSIAVWDENGGPRYALRGGQGDVSFGGKQGEPLILKFKFHGSYEPVIDDATPPTVTDSTLVPPTLLSSGVSIHGVSTLALDGFDFSKGNVISPRGDINNASGIKGAWITGHKPMIKVSPEMVTVASHDFFGRWRAGTTGVFTTGVIGSGTGNRVQFLANRTQYHDLSTSERDGARTLDLGIAITTAGNAVSGDDYSLTLT